VAGVHGLEHVQRLRATALPHDDALRPHAQGIDDQVADGDAALALDVGRAGFQRHDVVLAQLQLGRVLDGDDALIARDEAAQDVEQGGLARKSQVYEFARTIMTMKTKSRLKHGPRLNTPGSMVRGPVLRPPPASRQASFEYTFFAVV